MMVLRRCREHLGVACAPRPANGPRRRLAGAAPWGHRAPMLALASVAAGARAACAAGLTDDAEPAPAKIRL